METTMRVRRRDVPAAGFSMVELLVVIGLIAIMAAFALPGIARYIRNYRIRGAANEIATALQQARLRAVASNVNYGVLFVPLSDHSYQVVREDGIDMPGDKQRPSGDRRPLSWLLTPPQVNQQAGAVQLLPPDVVFTNVVGECRELAAAVPTPYAPDTAIQALRFNRLGAICTPAGTSEPCPQVDAGEAFFWKRGDNDVAVCVVERRSGLTRSVMVSPGGRVKVVDSETESNPEANP